MTTEVSWVRLFSLPKAISRLAASSALVATGVILAGGLVRPVILLFFLGSCIVAVTLTGIETALLARDIRVNGEPVTAGNCLRKREERFDTLPESQRNFFHVQMPYLTVVLLFGLILAVQALIET